MHLFPISHRAMQRADILPLPGAGLNRLAKQLRRLKAVILNDS